MFIRDNLVLLYNLNYFKNLLKLIKIKIIKIYYKSTKTPNSLLSNKQLQTVLLLDFFFLPITASIT